MATSKPAEPSATELELKRRGRRRLIGAITLGLLAVVFLPMIFDSEPRRSGSAMKPQEISVQLPARDGQGALPAPSVAPTTGTPAAPVATPPAVVAVPTGPATSTVPAAVDAAKPPVPEAARVETKPEKPAATAEKPAPVAKSGKPERSTVAEAENKSTTDKKGFVVQLGVFSDADNAKQAIGKVKEAKLPVYTESIPIKSGTATRVRVGPFSTREKADAALAQVKLAGGDGKIVPLK